MAAVTARVAPSLALPPHARHSQESLLQKVWRCACCLFCCAKRAHCSEKSEVFVKNLAGEPVAVKAYCDRRDDHDQHPGHPLSQLYQKVRQTGQHCLTAVPVPLDDNNTAWVSPWAQATGTDYEHVTNGEFFLKNAQFRAHHPHPEPHKNVLRMVFDLLSGPLEIYQAAQTENMFEYGIGDLKLSQYLPSSKHKQGLAPYLTWLLADLPEYMPPIEYTTGYYPETTPDDKELLISFIHSSDLFALQVILVRLLGMTLFNTIEFDESQTPETYTLPECIQSLDSTLFSFSYSDDYDRHPPTWIHRQTTAINDSIQNIINSQVMPDEYTLIARCLFTCLKTANAGYLATYALKSNPKDSQAKVIETLKEMQAYIKTTYLPNSGPTGSPLPSRAASPDPESKD